ncbi:4-hydroxythreonine-4-phosphate dehydrogenase [Leptolyngbya sp. BL0902]|uniref:4-hydroxythreonine-4-phosphate dehydrogenase PdxA n=1 Tax=Leptolyngbya sp. BL0902 TaxID=1115757 RepID=UPI0018E8C3CC|nr:4-hydroxythreonine-4-phosphate dehydrogenase PdxA [Leptolyngbya sp. BL0902]QQE65040.1 4-hydroxythreonine-4-phosphate dehydrogenase [Leptolyngbya sp. BL0902]
MTTIPKPITPHASAATAPSRPRLVIPLGDPAGIGPEVVLKALASKDWSVQAEITLLSSAEVLERTLAHFSHAPGVKPWPQRDQITLVEVPSSLADGKFDWGQESAATGAASFAYLKAAIAATVSGQFEAIVTAPIAKSAWKAAGHNYPGQTELLAEGAGVQDFAMAFVARSPHTGWPLRTMLATTHIPLQRVPQVLNPALMSQKLDLLIRSLRQDFGIAQPRIAIAGLNPHSGEGGQLGREEQDWLIPWLEAQCQRYPQAQLDGPTPPDTLWVRPGQAWFGTESQAMPLAHDAYLALYHDQGLIPVKLMAFDRAVNTTLGLPFIRTSPDHGTAFDIAGKGIADPSSMIAAIDLAIELAQVRLGQSSL